MRLLILLAAAAVMFAPEVLPQSATQSAQQATPPANQSAQAPADAVGPKSVGTMSELMLDMVFPTSNELFYVGREEQKSQKDWNDLRNNMLMLNEAANVLMGENRAKDKDQWMKDAMLLWSVSNKAFKMSKAKDLEGMKALNDELYEACQSCHVHYRPGYKRRL
jgi:hypothetical protein